jgi:hypothetical protein
MTHINLDDLAPLVEALDKAEAEAKKWAAAAETLKKRIQSVMGDGTEGLIAGQPAFTWRHTGQFNARRFTQDHPDLITKYTRPVTREELDVEALKAEQAELFTAYRARVFRKA